MINYLSKFKKVIIFLIIAPAQFAYAADIKENETPHRIVLTNGYFEDTFNSNEGMAYFPMSLYDTYDWAFRKLSVDNSGFSRFSSWLVASFLGFYINESIGNTPFHEFGHGTRFRSYGNHDIIYYPYGGSYRGDNTNSYFSMVLLRALSGPGEAAASSPAYYASSDNTPTNDITVSAGGMNNEILLTRILSERIHTRGGSVPDFTFYLNNKLSPYFYSGMDPSGHQGNDPDSVLKSFALIGKNITRDDLKNSYLFSTFASGTFYSLLFGNAQYIYSGKQHISAIDIYGFSLPDFYSYINTKGLSMEMLVHYKVKDYLNFALSYEINYKGDNYNQITPSIQYQIGKVASIFDNVLVRPDLVIGIGSNSIDIGGSFLADATVNNYFGIFTKYTYYNKNNLYGERNIAYINNPNEFLFGTYLNLL